MPLCYHAGPLSCHQAPFMRFLLFVFPCRKLTRYCSNTPKAFYLVNLRVKMDLQNLRLAADVGQVAWRCSTRVTRVMLQRQRVTSAGLVVILCARLTRFSYFLVLIYLLIVSSCASYRAMSCCRVGGWLESFLTRVRACLNSAKRNSSNRKEKVKGACVCGVRAWCTKA